MHFQLNPHFKPHCLDPKPGRVADANAFSITAIHDIISFLDLPALPFVIQCSCCHRSQGKFCHLIHLRQLETVQQWTVSNPFFLLGRHHLFFVPCLRTVSVAFLSEWMGQGFRACEGGNYAFLWIAPSKRCFMSSRRRITSNPNCFIVILQLTVEMLFPVFLSFSSFSLLSTVPAFSPSPNGSVLEMSITSRSALWVLS